MEGLGIAAAFAAGVLSFLSPCVLPLVPGYISFISGISLEEMQGGVDRWRNLGKASLGSLFFGAGFTLVFILLGATATVVGKFLFVSLPLLQRIAGAIIVVFGLHILGLFHLKFLYRERRFFPTGRRASLLGGFFLGMAFALGWTPCLGPILAGILAYASTQQTVAQGMLLLGVYSLGLGVPFLAVAVAMNAFEGILQRVKRHMRTLELVSGVLLIILGIMVYTGSLSQLAYYVVGLFGNARYP